MSEKSKSGLWAKINLILQLSLITIILFLAWLYYQDGAGTTDPDRFVPVITYAVVIVVLIPWFFIINAIRRKHSVSRAQAYLRGGVFVIRLSMVVFVTFSVYYEWSKLKSMSYQVFDIPVKDAKVQAILDCIKADERENIYAILDEIQDAEHRLDDYRIMTTNAQWAVKQAHNDPDQLSDYEAKEHIERRLMYFATQDSLLDADFVAFEGSGFDKYISLDEFTDLLVEYGKFYQNINYIQTAREFYRKATVLNPESSASYLAQGQYFLSQYNYQEAQKLYQEYVQYLKSVDKADKIPREMQKILNMDWLGTKLHRALGNCWFENINLNSFEYTEEEPFGDNYLKFGDIWLAEYYGSTQNLLYGSWPDSVRDGLLDCFVRIIGKKPEKNRYMGLEAITGLQLYTKTNGKFKYINPEIIKWATENLIPDTDLEIMNNSVQQIYNQFFRNELRSKAEAHFLVNHTYDLNQLAQEYAANMEQEDFDAIFYLDKYFADVENTITDENYKYRVTSDIGFWLRRSIDGSEAACWRGLQRVLYSFDSDWIESTYYAWDSRLNEYEDGEYEENYEEDYEGEGS